MALTQEKLEASAEVARKKIEEKKTAPLADQRKARKIYKRRARKLLKFKQNQKHLANRINTKEE